MNKAIAIIPARGGSKRLKGKNLRMLDNMPLIAHSINYALKNSKFIDKVVVSTEDSDIKKVALKYGAEVIDRPDELSSDTADSLSVLKHVIESYTEVFENVILLQPTNPLRPRDLIEKAFICFENGNYDSLITVTPVRHKLGEVIKGKYVPKNYTMGQRSQDMKPLYFENGLLYITKSSLIRKDMLIGKNNYAYILDHLYGNVDIDFQADLEFAEFLLDRERGNEL